MELKCGHCGYTGEATADSRISKTIYFCLKCKKLIAEYYSGTIEERRGLNLFHGTEEIKDIQGV